MDLLYGVINESVRQHLRDELVGLGIQVLSQFFLSNPQIVNDAVVHNLKRALDIISIHKEDLKNMSDPRANLRNNRSYYRLPFIITSNNKCII